MVWFLDLAMSAQQPMAPLYLNLNKHQAVFQIGYTILYHCWHLMIIS